MLWVSSSGHTEEVDRGVARERREVRTEGRPEVGLEMGHPEIGVGDAVPVLHRCVVGTKLEPHWSHTGTAVMRHSCYTGTAVVLQ